MDELKLYVDDDSYICFKSNLDVDKEGIFWTLHHNGWVAFFPNSDIPDYETNEITFPSDDELGEVTKLFEEYLKHKEN